MNRFIMIDGAQNLPNIDNLLGYVLVTLCSSAHSHPVPSVHLAQGITSMHGHRYVEGAVGVDPRVVTPITQLICLSPVPVMHYTAA